MATKFKIRKGDKVIVTSGRDKGRKGDVLKVLRAENRVLVSGVNMVKRHSKQTTKSQGGIVEKEAPIQISNLSIQDPKDGKATKVGFRFLEDGRKVRFSRRTGEVIDR